MMITQRILNYDRLFVKSFMIMASIFAKSTKDERFTFGFLWYTKEGNILAYVCVNNRDSRRIANHTKLNTYAITDS